MWCERVKENREVDGKTFVKTTEEETQDNLEIHPLKKSLDRILTKGKVSYREGLH